MADLMDRVSTLEGRTEAVERDVEVALARGDRATTAHEKSLELLNALRVTQAEQGRTLGEHSRALAEHSRTLELHGRLLAEFGATQAEHTRILTMHTSRMDSIDRRMDSIDGRMDSIDGKLGVLTLGMHTIESLLRGLTAEEGQLST